MGEDINKTINEWEKEAYENNIRQPDYPAEKYFTSISSYNKGFVDFLADFYQLNDKKILDYGCGLGMIADLFSNHSHNVSACDLSESLINSAEKLSNNEIKFFQDDFFNSGLEKNSFDFIFCRGLGPLQKIDYSPENSIYVKKLISSLTENGVAYFTLLGNLTGIPGNRLTGFQNHRLQEIYDFFSKAGYVSMINIFGKQAVIVTKSKESCMNYNSKMYSAVKNMLKNLREFDEIGFLKCRIWLYVNSNDDEILPNFTLVERYLSKKIFPLLAKNLCFRSEQKIVPFPHTQQLFFVSGDTDKFFERDFTEKMFRQNIIKRAPKWVKKKVFSR